MSVEKKEIGILPNIKDLLKNGDVNQALNGLGENVGETLSFKSDCNRVGLEIVSMQDGIEGNKNTNGINDILAKYLIPKNNIA